MAETRSLMRRPWATGAAIVGIAMLAFYVALIVAEGNNSLFEVLPWAMLMATGAVIAFASAPVADRRLPRNLLLGATVLFGVIGAISLLGMCIRTTLSFSRPNRASPRGSPSLR
ncbi:MAG TPA: hypothetical protein VLA29_05985 [Acidimicrobiia bacterium]|nr:hypothetical protein [Acidimicrobiia bacterium]